MRMRLLSLLLALPMLMAAQTKKPAAITLDVDRLYAKYKDQETITIQSADGEITAYVKIELNDAGKPIAVILYGWRGDSYQTLLRLKESLVAAKKRAGYRYKGYTSVSARYPDGGFGTGSAEADLYEKGSQYAKYGIGIDVSSPLDRLEKNYRGRFFYFEVGDVRRRSTSKQEPFTF